MITQVNKFGVPYYKIKPFKHQDDIVAATNDKRAYALFWEMGAGKTKPILDSAQILFCQGEIDGLLVISDNGAYRNWTDYEVPKHVISEIPTRVAYWSSTMRAAETSKANQLLVAKDDTLDILVMNVEAFAGERAPIFAEAFLRSHYAMGVVDESVSIKNPKAKRTQAILALRELCEYRRILTGTPITNSPVDLFSQFEFLGKNLLGFDSFVAFRNYFCRMILRDLGKGRKFYQVLGYQNMDYLTKIIQPWSSRILKSECLDLPEKVYEVHHVDHTPEQAAAYENLKSTALVQLEQGLLTVTSALTALVKLHQINCGHVKLDDGSTAMFPNNRVTELLKILERIGQKTIIWAHFTRDIETICGALPPGSWVNYYGKTTEEERPAAIRRFMTDPSCLYFVSNQATGGRGITLTEACYTIYYSQDYNLNHRLQSEDRIHRPGQRNICTYIDMVVPNTVDQKILDALLSKKDLAFQVLDSIREILV